MPPTPDVKPTRNISTNTVGNTSETNGGQSRNAQPSPPTRTDNRACISHSSEISPVISTIQYEARLG